MLVLARTLNKDIHIGDDIVLTVLSIRGRQVKLGFKAPKAITIHRAEVVDKIIADLHAKQVAKIAHPQNNINQDLLNSSTLKSFDDSRTHIGKTSAVLSSRLLHHAHATKQQQKQIYNAKTKRSNHSLTFLSTVLSNTGESS